MNKRAFLRDILATCIAPRFLPGTGKPWKDMTTPAINPAWRNATHGQEISFQPLEMDDPAFFWATRFDPEPFRFVIKKKKLETA